MYSKDSKCSPWVYGYTYVCSRVVKFDWLSDKLTFLKYHFTLSVTKQPAFNVFCKDNDPCCYFLC